MYWEKHVESIICGFIFVIGLIILINSISLANIEMSNIMRLNGGGMDTGTYLVYLAQSITKYRYLGTILSMLGGLGVLINTCVKYK